MAEKTKCQKMNVTSFTTKLGWIISPGWWGAKSFEANLFYNDSQHNKQRKVSVLMFVMHHAYKNNKEILKWGEYDKKKPSFLIIRLI